MSQFFFVATSILDVSQFVKMLWLMSFICKATKVTHTKPIDRNLLRKETSFVCYTSSVMRKNRHMKQKEKITHCCQDQNSTLQKFKITKFYKKVKITKKWSRWFFPLKWSGHQLKNFERQGMTYELLLEIFSMKKLNSLLYRNCSVNFFTVPPELTRVGMLGIFPLHVTVCCKPRYRLRQKPR